MDISPRDNSLAWARLEELDRRMTMLEAIVDDIQAMDERSHAILTSALDAIIMIDAHGRVTEFNPAAEQMFGYQRSAVLGQNLASLIIPPSLRDAHQQGLQEFVATRTPHIIGRRVEVTGMRSDGSEFPVELLIQAVETAETVAFVGYLRDISERLRAESHLRILADVGAALSAAHDEETALSEMVRIIVGQVCDWCAVYRLDKRGDLQVQAFAHTDPSLASTLQAMIARFPPTATYPIAVHDALRTRQARITARISEYDLAANALSADHLAMLSELQPRSVLAVPLSTNGRAIGVIEFVRARPNWDFDERDQALGEELARRAALAVDSIRLHRDTEHNLQRSEETRAVLETLLQSIPAGVAFLDRDLRFVQVNEALAIIHGVPAKDHIGRTLTDIIGGITAQIMPHMQHALVSGEPVLNIDVIRPGATSEFARAHYLANYYPVHTDTGEVIGLSVVVVDVSARRASEDRARFLATASRVLSESLEYAETLTHVTRLVVPALADCCIIDMRNDDESVERLSMSCSSTASSEHASSVHHVGHTSLGATSGIKQVLDTGRPLLRNADSPGWLDTRGIDANLFPDDAARPTLYAWMCVPMLVRGRTIGAITFIATNPEREYAEADVSLAEEFARRAATAIDNARLYREAQDAVHLREQFLSIASHELKTPLTSVKVAAQLIERWSGEPLIQQARLARVSHQLIAEVGRLEALVSDLLDASRVHQGRLELRPAPMDLAALAADVLQRAEHAPERLPTHRLVLDAPEPTIGEWDAARLDQVITNLVSNALKYSPDGGVVRVDIRKGVRDALLRVSDEGIGVPLEDRARLFQPFSRSESVHDSIGGTGLGLFISAQIVELHGGTIGVTSRVGGGSAFTVTLPLVTSTNAS